MPTIGYTLSNGTEPLLVNVNVYFYLQLRWRLTQVSASTIGTFCNILPGVASKDGYVYSDFLEDRFFANSLEQWTQAARPKELVILTIFTQCARHYALLRMDRPAQ